MPRVHRRQFVLGPEPLLAGEDWVQSPVAGFGFLSRCPELPAERVLDADGSEWWLLGAAWAEPSPAEQIAAARTAEIPARYREWSGRWLLVGGGAVHMDAGGLLGCFFAGDRASSSAALLAGSERASGPPLWPTHGLDWCPPPFSRFESVRRLLPSQLLLPGGRVAPRPLLANPAPRDYEAVLDEARRLLVGGMRSAARTGTLHVALSGGRDSRVVLAAAVAGGVPVRAFTHGFSGITGGDRDLPPKLARLVGCEHAYIVPGAHHRELLRVFDEHTAGHTLVRDRAFIAHEQWEWCRSTDTVVRGGGFEVGRCGWARLLHPLDRPALRELPRDRRAEEIVRAAGDRDPRKRRALDEWLAWCSAHEEPMDWRDRFFWEQRLAGWMSSVEQALDLVPGSKGHVANSHRFYELVLSLPEEVRRSSKHHHDLLARMAPRLLELPFNPKDPLAVRVSRKVLKILDGWYRRLVPGGGP